MAKLNNSITSKLLNPVFTQLANPKPYYHNLSFVNSSNFIVTAAASSSSSSSSNKKQDSQNVKKNLKRAKREPRRRQLISFSTSNGKWQDSWSDDYVFSLRDLQLADLVEDEQQDTDVFVNLSVQKHAGFGFSIDGRVVTSFSRKCSRCSTLYCIEIDSTFDVCILPSSKGNKPDGLPEIGGSDPSVIFVKPGSVVELDSEIQDTIRLAASAKNTCSKSCGKTTTIRQYTDGRRNLDRRLLKFLR